MANRMTVEQIEDDARFGGMEREERIEARIIELEKKVFNGLSNVPGMIRWMFALLLALFTATIGLLVNSAIRSTEIRGEVRSIQRQVDRIELRLQEHAAGEALLD